MLYPCANEFKILHNRVFSEAHIGMGRTRSHETRYIVNSAFRKESRIRRRKLKNRDISFFLSLSFNIVMGESRNLMWFVSARSAFIWRKTRKSSLATVV